MQFFSPAEARLVSDGWGERQFFGPRQQFTVRAIVFNHAVKRALHRSSERGTLWTIMNLLYNYLQILCWSVRTQALNMEHNLNFCSWQCHMERYLEPEIFSLTIYSYHVLYITLYSSISVRNHEKLNQLRFLFIFKSANP